MGRRRGDGASSDDDAHSAASDVEDANGVDAAAAADAGSVGSAASGEGMDVDESAAADDAMSHTSFAAPAGANGDVSSFDSDESVVHVEARDDAAAAPAPATKPKKLFSFNDWKKPPAKRDADKTYRNIRNNRNTPESAGAWPGDFATSIRIAPARSGFPRGID